METKNNTQKKAENLSLFLYGYITSACKWRIEQGEESTVKWIKSISKKYHVIP